VNATVDLHSSDVPSTEQRNYKQDLNICCVLQNHYDDESYKIVFLKTTPDLQNSSMQDQGQNRVFGLRPVLS